MSDKENGETPKENSENINVENAPPVSEDKIKSGSDNESEEKKVEAENKVDETNSGGKKDGVEDKQENTQPPSDQQPPTENVENKENKEGDQSENQEKKEGDQGEDGGDGEGGGDGGDTGDEVEEKQEFKKRKQDEKPPIPEDFYYDYDSLIFRPVTSEESNLPQNLLNLFHSYGYDCKKRSNLHLLDANTLIFSAGNMSQILNIKTKEHIYLRTTSGGAVGAIAIHPTRKYFAIGEKGNLPNINVFEYPSLKLHRILRQGTIKGYAFLDFNTHGDLLASLGAAPDFMLTLWDWRQENIVLRTKAFSQDIFKVTFSKDLKGILTTAGIGHIKFWKMANTFTGFKLQGELGKFGKTEISDIEGYAELPDGKVLSGCEWGNMLLWDGGLIQTEICRKKNKPCHVGSIQQITLDEGDIYTIGEDGSVRVWDFETIDTAEPSEEGTKLEIEPLNELLVGKNVALRSMIKDCAEESTVWYAQDSNGGIWRLDLSFSASSEYPKQLFAYHAGVIHGIDTCPNSHLFATTADDGSVKLYNYLTYEIVAQRKFSKGGTYLKWLPTTIDTDGATIMTGFHDGVLRFIKVIYKPENSDKPESMYELILFEVFKPHTKAITSIAIDAKSEIIATGSEDNTVFFFSNSKNKRIPIGFVNVPAPITYMCWTPGDYAKTRLLVCMKDGTVYEYDAPVPNNYDITKSYLIEMKLTFRKYKFRSIKSRLRHEEELERKRIEEEERKKKEAEERRLRGEDDEEEKKKKEESKEGDKKEGDEETEKAKAKKEEVEEEQPPPKQDEWKPYIPETPSKINWAHYSSPDTFWVSMDDYDAGYLYECKFLTDAEKTRVAVDKIDEPIRSVAVQKSDLTHSEDIPLTSLTFNKSKTHAFIGQKNGIVRYQPVPDSKAIEDIKHYWSYGYHDNDYGRIIQVCLSFDERFVFSVGADSNIFGYLFNAPPEAIEKAKAERIRIPSKATVTETTDIDDPNAYSIEQAKQKSEHDKMMAEAEAKKQDMRQKIHHLRKQFKDLSTKNDQLVPRLRVSRDEFLLEESIKEQVLKQIDDKIKLTHRELEWYTEKCRISLDKLKSRFKDIIDCEHLVVYTFDGTHYVATFRSVQLPRDIDKFEADLVRQYTILLNEKLKAKESLEAQNSLDRDATGAGDVLLPGLSAAEQMKKIFGKLRGNTAARVERALRKMDEKKLKRLKRRKEWEDLLHAKLPDNYENPEDLGIIKYAEDNIGDFKLKTDENFIVPEEQRMNVFKASKQLIAIKQLLHFTQMAFNERIIGLRDLKIKLVNEINKDIDRIEEIQAILQNTVTLPDRPKMRPEEVPEKQYEYNKEKLAEFKKEMESKATRLEKAGHEDEGFGGFAAGAQAPKKAAETTGFTTHVNLASVQKIVKAEPVKPLYHNKDSMSSLMLRQAQIQEVKLVYEQEYLLKRIDEKIQLFDGELKLLRHDRAKVSLIIKNIDLRHVTLYEELMLLREFEKTENDLEDKLEKRKEEHQEMYGKLTEIQQKIDGKRKDIEKIDEKLKQLLDTYHQMTQDESKFGDFLTKLYKKKIKRKKKAEGEEEDEESEEESDESDSEDEDEDLDDEDSEAEGHEQLDLDMCPNGLSQQLYDQVCQLREKRLDLEEAQAEEKKILEQFKKDQENAIKKSRVVENTLKQAQQELENFQKEKQKKLNNLDIVVTLSFNQIQFMDKGYLPSDLSESLVFDARNLDRLQERIKELQVEKVSEKRNLKTLKQHHLELNRDQRKMDEYLAKLEEECNKMMADKFGKLVDIEKLELIAVNQQIEELKQKMAENEFEHEKIMREWLSKINDEKDESISLLKANTSRVNELVELMQESKKMDKYLNSKQKNLGEEFSGISRKDLDERERLHTLVQLQAQEIEALKAEISILSRKGGHILPPTQPPANQVQTTS